MNYIINFTGMDSCEHNEEHSGNRESLIQQITFIEERGGHGISAEDDEGTVVYCDGSLVPFNY